MSKRLAAVALACAAISTTAIAHAQDSAAEALFQKGHQLFEEKRYAEACPKFAESFRLDAVTGSLLALAACHDAEGKLASAWSEYLEVAKRARAEGKNDRADAAQQRAAILEPKLGKLTIALAQGADLPELQVKRDGVVVERSTLGTPVPANRGEHVIEVTAPGRQPFSKRVTVLDGATQLVPIPILVEADKGAADAPPAGPRAEAPQSPRAPESPQGSTFPLRTVGIVAAAVGVVTLGIGTYFGISAISKNSDSNVDGHCAADVCDSIGKQSRLDAISAGNTSTALFVVGGLLTAGGIVLYIVGGSSASTGGGDAKPAVAAGPVVSPGGGGFALTGRF